MNRLERAIRRPRTLAVRRWLFQIHLWAGILTGLYALFIGVTGSILVFHEELTGLSLDRYRQIPIGVKRTAPDDWVQAVRQATGYKGMLILEMPQQPADAVQAIFYPPAGAHFVFVNPYTSAVIAEVSQEGSLLRLVDGLHSNFRFGRTGRLINGILGLALLVLAITGIFIWWPGPALWKRRLTVDFGARWKRVNYDLHNSIGFWGMGGLALLCITGAYFTWPQIYRNSVAVWFPLTPRTRVIAEPVDKPKPAALSEIIEAANAAVPDRRIWRVELPPGQKEAVRILKWGKGSPAYLTATTIHVHPYTAQTLRIDRYEDRTTGDKIVGWIGPLHAGSFGGLGLKIVYGILGLVPALLFLTGFLMWWDRVVKNKWLAARSSTKETATAA